MEDKFLQVSELFFSIQGESLYSGFPCLFIRLSGCNLRCTYCDAKYTYEEPGQEKSIASLLDFSKKHPKSLVEVTGGEPMLQENINELLAGLVDLDRTVLLETNGSIDLSKVPAKIIKIVDLKCPSSGMHEKMHLENFSKLRMQDEIKCVISNRSDYDWAVEVLASQDLFSKPFSADKATITFSPVTTALPAAQLAQWILTDNLPVRLQVQLHKILWPNLERGA